MGKRMYYIFKIIYQYPYKAISAKDILKQLEEYHIYVEVKTVYSCIQNINAFFYEWLQDDLIISVKRVGFTIQRELLSDGELQFLLDSIVFHQDLKDDDKECLKEKLLKWSSAHQQKRLVQFVPNKRELHFSLFLNLTTLMKAIENKQVISFQYINYVVKDERLHEIPSLNGNRDDQYMLSPYQIVNQNNHYYVIGYNEKYQNQLTTYRVDRMRTISTIHQSFIEIREQFDMIDEIEKMTNMYVSHQRDTLEIECDKKVLREIASRFGTHIKAKKLYQDRYLMTIENIPISDGLVGWILMMQDQVKVISPLFLRKEIECKLEKMLSLYQQKNE